MTLIVAWLSHDQKKPSAAYIAADSRISCDKSVWDCAKKVFVSKTQPMIFGYCGSVLVPSTLLAQLVDSIDSGFLFNPAEPVASIWQSLCAFFQRGLKGSLPFMSKAPSYVLGIHRTGDNCFSNAVYTIQGLHVALSHEPITLNRSSVLHELGSGAPAYREIAKHTASKNCNVSVSRIYFASFCRAIRSNKVSTVGGPPQLAALRTKGGGQILPVKFGQSLWQQGMKLEAVSYRGECFDETFQRINPETLNLVEGAQRQPLR